MDAGGLLVSPPFVDAHFHMDSTLSYGQPRVNESGTLLEGIALWGELKPQLTHDAIVQRALQYCDWAGARGLLAVRSHVDTSDPSLLPVQALLDVKQRVAPYPVDAHQLRVAPRHEQRDKGKGGRVGAKERRQQMPFKMVYTQHRPLQRCAQGAGNASTHQ